MKPGQGIAFIRKHGVVLESARGPVPSLAESIAGEPLRGSWLSHPKSKEIFKATRAARDGDDVLVCRLIEGKITFVHRRLWPALVRVSNLFSADRLARVREVHTASGSHATQEVPFPDWVPREVVAEAERLSEQEACGSLGLWAATLTKTIQPA
jgi:hypothetical protein